MAKNHRPEFRPNLAGLNGDAVEVRHANKRIVRRNRVTRQAAMKPYLDSYKLAGVVSLIADKSGKIHYKNQLCYADVEAKKPITEDNIFWIASMTKMFAGASIMMLADEGKVSLDDPVTSLSRNSRDGWWSKKRMNPMSC